MKGSNPNNPQGPTLMTSPNPNYLPKDIPLNTVITLGVGVPTGEFGGQDTNMRSITDSKAGALPLDFGTYCKTIVIKRERNSHTDRRIHQRNSTEMQDIGSCLYGQLTFNKDVKII